MNNIDIALKEYLNQETNYAIIITGKYGVGKTFYYKNNLTKLISDTIVPGKSKKEKYIPIDISLFGLKSISDIQTQILLSFINKKSKYLSPGILKVLAKGLSTFTKIDKIDDLVGNIKIDFENLVICFDDLDRKSDNLSIKELIGFVNLLVENNNAKVVLIANEIKLKEKIEKNEYEETRKKVIGISLEFNPVFREQIIEIINSKYKSSSFSKFLDSYLDIINEFTQVMEHDLRVLIFTLDKLYSIYNEIETHLINKPDETNKIILENLHIAIRFAIAISIEYRSGLISHSTKTKFNISKMFYVKHFVGDIQKEESTKTFLYKFIEKYYNGSLKNFEFFESIFNHVVYFDKFDIKKFINESRSSLNIQNGSISPQNCIINKLNYNYCFELSEKEYCNLTKKMVSYAEKGQYVFYLDYFRVFDNALRFDNILNYNPKTLKEKIIKGIRKRKSKFKYEPYLDSTLNFQNLKNTNHQSNWNEIKKCILIINEEIRKESQLKESNEKIEILLNELNSNWDSFTQSSANKLWKNGSEWKYAPVFNDTTINKIHLVLNKMNNMGLNNFNYFLQARYDNLQHTATNFKSETNFWKALYKKLNSNKKKENTVRNYLLIEIIKQIKKMNGFLSPN